MLSAKVVRELGLRRGDPVQIRWLDAEISETAWSFYEPRKAADHARSVLNSYGVFIAVDTFFVYYGLSDDATNGMIKGLSAIPIGCILSIKELS